MRSSYRVDIEAYARAGFDAVELWLAKIDKFLERNSLDSARAVLEDNGVRAVGACATGGIMLPGNKREAFDAFKGRLELASALGAPVIVLVTDFPEKLALRSYDRAVDNLKKASDIARTYHIKLAVEFIKGAKFLGTLGTTLKLVRRVRRSNVGVLFDTFHFYCGLSQFPDILEAKDEEIFFVHINDCRDVPRETAQDSDRTLPGKGVFPLREIINSLQKIGYRGYYSLELFQRELWRKSAEEVARLAYRSLRTLALTLKP